MSAEPAITVGAAVGLGSLLAMMVGAALHVERRLGEIQKQVALLWRFNRMQNPELAKALENNE